MIIIFEVPPLSFATYFISPSASFVKLWIPEKVKESPLSIENDFYILSLSPDTGTLSSIFDKQTSQTRTVVHEFFQYGEDLGKKLLTHLIL